MTTGVLLCCAVCFDKVSLNIAASRTYTSSWCRSLEHSARAPAASPSSSSMPTASAAPASSSVPAGQAQHAMTKGTQHSLAKRCSLPLSLPAAALHNRQPLTRQMHRASNLAETAVCARLSGTLSPNAVGVARISLVSLLQACIGGSTLTAEEASSCGSRHMSLQLLVYFCILGKHWKLLACIEGHAIGVQSRYVGCALSLQGLLYLLQF